MNSLTHPSRHHPPSEVQPVVSRCPSCNQVSRFTFIGVQHWPQRVAEKLGIKATSTLWRCSYCDTTISNVDEEIHK